MRLLYKSQPRDLLHRDDFQESLDFFYDNFLDFFITGEVGG